MNRVALKIILIILIFIVCIFCFTALFFYLYMVNKPDQDNTFSLTFYIFAIITAIGIITIVGLIISLLPKEQRPRPGVVSKEQVSYFDGKTLGWVGRALLYFFVTLVSLGWAYPWMRCMLERWKAEHTVINGRRLRFKGKGSDLFINHLIWSLLTSVTFGVYGIISPLEFEKWKAEQIYSEPDTGVKPRNKPRTKLVIIALIILAVEMAVYIFLVIMFYTILITALAGLPLVGSLFAS